MDGTNKRVKAEEIGIARFGFIVSSTEVEMISKPEYAQKQVIVPECVQRFVNYETE